MTEYTENLCTGGVATAENSWSSWTPDKAFDGYVGTGWHYPAANLFLPTFLKYQFTEAKRISKYTVRNRYGTNGQCIKTWTFQGSNDDSTWTTLHSAVDEDWTGIYLKEFTFSNSNNYLYYRLYVTAVHADGDITIMEMGMMEEVRTVPVSTIYSVGHRGNLRGKANQGLIRPTIKQFFMSSPDWEEKFRGYKAKSVIFDINSRYGGDNYGIRKVEFFDNNTLHILNNNYEAYHSSTFNINYYQATFVFNSNLTKLGSAFYNSWASVKTGSPQRLIIVFDNELTFNKIIVNNYHNVGDLNSLGLKNVKITITDEVITNTTPNTSIQNGIVIFDDIFEQHTAVNEVQDWEVPLVSPSV